MSAPATSMHAYQREFIEFMVRAGVLVFGDFTTKSGRKTPYFVNTGRYDSGEKLRRLGSFYAAAIRAREEVEFDVLFGPAYKGIPLCTAVAVALHQEFGHEVGYCFNRKEAKDHGEGGNLVGHSLRDGDRVLVVEDVITAGTAVREAIPVIQAAADVELAGLVVSVDRMERGPSGKAALAEVGDSFGLDAFAIVTIDEILADLRGREVEGRVVLDDATHARIQAYRAEHAATA